MIGTKKIPFLILLLALVLPAQSFAGKKNISKGNIDPSVVALALEVSLNTARLWLQESTNFLRGSVLPAPMPAPAAQAIDTNLHLAATEHGGDGWCGYNSLAAALDMPVAQMLSQTITYLTHMTEAQTAQVQNLLSLQQIAGHQQYQNIEIVAQLISQLQTLQGLAASGEALPVIHFWFDGFLSQIFEAALQVHIVIVQPVSDEASSGPNILPHPATNTHYAFNHHSSDTPLFQADSPATPVVTLVFGGNNGNLLAHYQLLSINGHATQTQGAFYDWLQQLILGLDHVAGSSPNWQLTGTPWVDVLEDQEAYWRSVFGKRGIGYYSENRLRSKQVTDHSKLESAVSTLEFTLANAAFCMFSGELSSVDMKILETFSQGREYLQERKALFTSYRGDHRQIWEREPKVEKVFQTLVVKTTLGSVSRGGNLYLDSMPGVGHILRTKEKIVAGTVLGEFTGDIFFRKMKGGNPTEDTYLISFLSRHPTEAMPASFVALSAKENGNEFRFMSAADRYTANVNCRLSWKKVNAIYFTPVITVTAARDISAKQHLVANYGDGFLQMIKEETGVEAVKFCHCCKEALGVNSIGVDLIKGRDAKILYCSKDCAERDDTENKAISREIYLGPSSCSG